MHAMDVLGGWEGVWFDEVWPDDAADFLIRMYLHNFQKDCGNTIGSGLIFTG